MRYLACAVTLSLCGIYKVSAQELKSPSVTEMEAAANQGDATAQYQLARAYLRGEGVPRDPQKAFDLMKAAANQGSADAIGGLGYFYSVGLVVPKDDTLAIEWFRKGAEKGSARAQLNLGNLLLKGQDDTGVVPEAQCKEALRWIQKAADQNFSEAAAVYGSILYFGDHGVEKNHELMAKYLKIAAEAGSADAQNKFGVLHEYGWGVPLDMAMAQQWFRKAAIQGNLKAQSNLGRTLGALSESKETRIEALAWLTISSEQGEITAKKELQGSLPALKSGDMEAASERAIELSKLIHPKPSQPK